MEVDQSVFLYLIAKHSIGFGDIEMSCRILQRMKSKNMCFPSIVVFRLKNCMKSIYISVCVKNDPSGHVIKKDFFSFIRRIVQKKLKLTQLTPLLDEIHYYCLEEELEDWYKDWDLKWRYGTAETNQPNCLLLLLKTGILEAGNAKVF